MVEQENFTKYERARIIGSRALQISMGAPILIKMSQKDLEGVKFNPIEIAKLEFKEGIIPITVKRPLPKSSVTDVN
jgi:DNA-directed RNA polymerase subunit K